MGRSCQLHRLLALQSQSVENNQQIYWQVRTLLSPVARLGKFHCLTTPEKRRTQDRRPRPPSSSTSSYSTYGRFQHLRITVSPHPSGFRPKELAAALRCLKPGKSPGLDAIFRELMLLAWSALNSWFCDFLNSCMRQLKIPMIWRRALIAAIPKPEKPIGGPKELLSYICCVSFLKSLRDSSTLVSNQPSAHCSRRSRRASDPGGRPKIRSPC